MKRQEDAKQIGRTIADLFNGGRISRHINKWKAQGMAFNAHMSNHVNL